MKTYREIYFRGTPNQLSVFVEQIGEFAVGDWKLRKKEERWKDYLFFDYVGNEVNKAFVSIHLGDNITNGEINVGNIIPLEKDELSINEYNDILLKFYNDVIKPYKENGTELSIVQSNDDNFNPVSIISENALEKLEVFCSAANKSTGSSHPCDRKRWFDFICQTVDDDKIFDMDTLSRFLQDENYWGEKPKGVCGVMGRYAWDEDKAYELANEYEHLCEILMYYKRERGI